MPVRTYTTRCTGKHTIASNVIELRLEKPPGFTFLPGQFVLFVVPLALPRTEAEHSPILREKYARGELRPLASGAWVENPHDTQTRAYSIASAPDDDELRFILKLVKGGRASRWVEEAVESGTEVVMQGPFGKFLLDRETSKPYLFIATGTGIAPFRSQLEWVLKVECDKRRMDLLFGVLRKEDLFWEEWMKDLEACYSNFHAHVSTLSGGPDWHGNRGSIQERAPKLLQENVASIYICGAPEMVKEVKELCLTTLALPKGDVHTEAYI